MARKFRGKNLWPDLNQFDPDQLQDKSGVNLSISRYVDTLITSAQLLALNATGQTVVAAPGAGKLILFERALLYMPYNSAAYAGIAAGEDLSFKYTNNSGAQVSTVETTGFLDQTSSQLRIAQPDVAAPIPVANAALVLGLLVGEITTGNSPLRVRTFYRIIPSVLS